jgi:hypothetical protein
MPARPSALLPLLHLGAALAALGPTLAAGALPGAGDGETAGHAFVATQVGRWARGIAPPGVADLLGHPQGPVPFWPVDPLLAAATAALSGFGPATPAALALVLLALHTAAGALPAALARRLGAAPLAAAAAGLALQLHPALLRPLGNGQREPLSLGLLALAAAALWAARRRPGLARPAAATALLAAASPTLAAPLPLLLPVAALRGATARGLLRLAAALALPAALLAAPLLLTETGPGGRLAPGRTPGGYHPAPDGLRVAVDGDPARLRAVPPPTRPPGPPPVVTPAAPPLPLPAPLHRLPTGLCLPAAALLALGPRRSRPFALAALALFALGPAPQLLLRALRVPIELPAPPLQALLQLTPWGAALGNPERLLLPALLLAALAAARAARGRPLATAALLALPVAEALARPHLLPAPATRFAPPPAILAALDAPFAVVPSGDAPAFHPRVGPKEALLWAAAAGQPVPADYGRGRRPADLPLQVALAAATGEPLDPRAWAQVPPGAAAGPDAWPAALPRVLLLEDRLPPAARAAARAWLAARGAPLADAPGLSVWARSPPPPAGSAPPTPPGG